MLRAGLIRHDADFFFDFDCIHHRDSVPGAAVKEAAVRTFAGALLAADTEDGVHLDAAEGRVVFVRHPEHAIFYRAVLHTGRGAGTTGAALGDNSQFFGFLLADGIHARGTGLEFHLV